MTLIVYPLADYNTFISLVDFDTKAQEYLNYDAFNNLPTDDQERYLATATRNIINTNGVQIPTVPDSTTDCLANSEVAIVMHDLKYNISVTTTTKETKKESVGSLSVEYFSPSSSTTVELFPQEVIPCLEGLGASYSVSDLVFGSIRKVR